MHPVIITVVVATNIVLLVCIKCCCRSSLNCFCFILYVFGLVLFCLVLDTGPALYIFFNRPAYGLQMCILFTT